MAKGYTDFVGGMLMGAELCRRSKETKYMDWNKAEQLCLEHPESTIHAGLMEDWNNTSGLVYAKGKWYDGYVYDQSKWATPILDIDGKEIECWTTEPHKGTGLPDWWGRGNDLYDEYDYEY